MQVLWSDRPTAPGAPGAGAPSAGTAVTIGAYDGVHLGHRHLLSTLKVRAAERGLRSTVVTFDRHPASVVRPESAPLLLTDLDQKLELLADCGIDLTLVVPFDADRAAESAEDFVTEVLVGTLGARSVVVGEDFHFGHGRRGNVALLRRMGDQDGFDVEGVALAGHTGDAVSSTRIRQLVADGDVAGAAGLLGRPHQVRGRVVHGDGRGGASLGFPTANVAVPAEIAVPGVGIYAGRYQRPDGTEHLAAISVGRRPTFYDPAAGEAAAPLVEAFLLDFDGDLYDEPARVSFVARLRDERRFEQVEDLIAQMRRDVVAAREVLSGDPG
jgi:riboflavin kinase/FMN adenylyltransferase